MSTILTRNPDPQPVTLPPPNPNPPVCAHLAAHRENVEGRNSDFANIIQKTVFIDKATSGDSAANVETSEEMRK